VPPAVEADTAGPLTAGKRLTVPRAADLALAADVAARKALTVAQAAETDTATTVGRIGGEAPAPTVITTRRGERGHTITARRHAPVIVTTRR
jgi:hypothetical protein